MPNGLTRIANSAFSGCKSLEYIELPSNLEEISFNAFTNCSSISEISIPPTVVKIGNSAFSGCSGLQKVIVKDIGSWCRIKFENETSNPLNLAKHIFYNKETEIKNLVITDSITTISNYAFKGAENLSSIHIYNNTPPSISTNTFSNTIYTWTDLYVPSGTKETYQNNSLWGKFISVSEFDAFSQLNITVSGYGTITFGKKILKDNGGTFLIPKYNVISLIIKASENYEIGELFIDGINNKDSIAEPKKEYSCTINGEKNIEIVVQFVETVNIGSTFVCDDIAYKKYSLNEVKVDRYNYTGDIVIPSIINYNHRDYHVTHIGSHAFDRCHNITSVIIPNGVTTIEEQAFVQCINLASVDLPNSITIIEKAAFSNCYGLMSLNIPYSITVIEDEVFRKCRSLTNLIIPDNIISIGSLAFQGCTALSTLTLSKNLNSIGSVAFLGCSSLTAITSLNVTPPTGIYFSEYTATLYVPFGSKEAYQNAEGWKNFTNIVEIDPSGIQNITLDKDINAPIYDLNGRKLKEPSKGINIIGGKKVVVK